MFRVGLILVACIPAASVSADGLLYQYEGDVLPTDPSAGWLVADACSLPSCTANIVNGKLVLIWAPATGDIVNFSRDYADSREELPETLWIEWRFRSNFPFPPTGIGCDARFSVSYRDLGDNVDLHGDAIFWADESWNVTGLEVDQFHTFRFESRDGFNFRYSADGNVFVNQHGVGSPTRYYMQFGGFGSCGHPTTEQRNEWDYIRFGTISDGEQIVGTDPPRGTVGSVTHPNFDRFTVTFDSPNFVHMDEISVTVTGGAMPVIKKTRRPDSTDPTTVEIVLDRPLTVGETTTFTFNDGTVSNVVRYTLVLTGACCLPNGTCEVTDSQTCATLGGSYSEGKACAQTEIIGQSPMNRYVGFRMSSPDPPFPCGDTALRVKLSSLHHPTDPPANTPDFTAYEGQYRYVNRLRDDQGNVILQCPDSQVLGTSFPCATLGCQPEYRDWAGELAGGVLCVTGDGIVPSSVYEVASIPAWCAGQETTCSTASPEVSMATARWGDVDLISGPLNVLDVAALVDKVKDLASGTLRKPSAQLRDNSPDPLENVNVLDVANGVDALKGKPYPFPGPETCP